MSGDKQRWRRLGLAFRPTGQKPWLRSHAQNPVSLHLEGSVHRVFFASRDSDNRAHITHVDLDLDDPTGSAAPADSFALAPGPLGHFDDYGVYPSSIVADGDRLNLYFIGVSAGREPPLFYASIGLALSEDGGESFERVSAAPIMARSDDDPCLVTAPAVLRDGGRWRMWYSAGLSWSRKPDGSLGSEYKIKYAESDDGVEWRRDGRICIDHVHPGESNIARPCVVRDDDGYRAWISYAGEFPYRLGYAESPDGLEWTRRDELLDLVPPAQDWDSDAQAYPWVLDHDGRRYMLYCGNEIGREGFGIAVEDTVPE